MGSVYRRNRSKDGKTVKNRTYSIKYKDERGAWVSEPAFTDKAASQALLKKRETEVERRKAGLVVVGEEDRRRRWADVVEEFARELASKGSDPAGPHVREGRRILLAVADACGWETLADARRDRFSGYLADMTAAGKAPLTRKQHLAFTRNMLNWCVSQGWLQENPVLGIKPPKVGQAGRRRKRRAYTRGELLRLLAATPQPRRTLYLIAALSGYRRKELRLMERRDADPAGDRPRWHLRPEVSKNKRLDVVPIVPDLLPVVAPLWSSLPLPTSRVVKDGLGISVPRHETLHRDLRRAGVARVDEHGRHADFHSLRYTFCRLMGEVLPIQLVKVLMRHSTIKLTADLYTELGIDDLGAKVWQLPPVLGGDDQGGEDSEQARPPAEQDQADAGDGEAA